MAKQHKRVKAEVLSTFKSQPLQMWTLHHDGLRKQSNYTAHVDNMMKEKNLLNIIRSWCTVERHWS